MEQAIPVNVMRRVDQPDVEVDLRRVRQLAELLDARFSVAGIRFGLDSIVGLIPGIGDVATLLAGLYPIYVATRHGIGLPTRARMLGNLLIDAAVGAVPVVGDVFDVAYKANTKNLKILEKALMKFHGVGE